MTTTHTVPKKITAILSLIALLPAIYIFSMWLKVYPQKDLSAAHQDTLFRDSFPGNLDVKTLLYICMAFCLLSIFLAAKGFRQRELYLRIVMMITVIIAAFIFFMSVFQVL